MNFWTRTRWHNVLFRQKDGQLRVLLVSLQGSMVTSAEGPLLELQLHSPFVGTNGIPVLREHLALRIIAEAEGAARAQELLDWARERLKA